MTKEKSANRILVIMRRMQPKIMPALLVITMVFGAEAWGKSEPASGAAKDRTAESARAPGLREDPISIIADRLEVNNKDRQAHFIGNVRAQQNDITLYSDDLTVTYSPEKPQSPSSLDQKKEAGFLPGTGQGEKIEKIIARGNVRFVQGDMTAEGEEAVFYSADRKIVLTGNPVIRRAKDRVSGERVTVFLGEELSIVEGKNDSRVQAVIYPEKGVKERP